MRYSSSAAAWIWVAMLIAATSTVRAGSETAGPWFTEVTADVHLEGYYAFRLSVADVNGDGYPDLLIHRRSDWDTGDVQGNQFLLLNVEGDDPGDPFSRKFVDFTDESGIRAARDGDPAGRHSDAGIFADVDNDGDLDLFTTVYLHRSYSMDTDTNDLLLNDGAGHFTLAPDSPFHTEPIYNTAAAVFMDYDNDGNIDLYIGNWYMNDNLTVDQLYRGHGDGTFTNTTHDAGIDAKSTCVYGIANFDWNDDGFTDLFAPPYSRTNLASIPVQWRNNGDGTFTQVQDQTGYDQNRGVFAQTVSFGSMPRDFDRDGDIDFFEIITHGTGDGNDGSIHSTAVPNVAGVFSWDFWRVHDRGTEDPDLTHHGDHYSTWFDYDGDGMADFALTESGYDNNRLYLFQQLADGSFHPVTVDSGLNVINTEGLPPHNVLALDYDLDGDEDLLVGIADNTHNPRLFRNDVGNQKHWLTVRLQGAGIPQHANRAAIGAKVEVTAGGTTWTREVYAGNGHMGPQVPLALTFALGDATAVDSVRVRWPNENLTVTELTGVEVDQFLTIAEPCPLPGDPEHLMLDKDGDDLLLSWDDPSDPGLEWNIYRDENPDPSGWGPPHAEQVTDADPGEPGIQYRDTGAASGSAPYFYLVTAVGACGESALR